MDLIDQRPRVHLAQAECRANGGQDLSRISQCRQINKYGAAGEGGCQPLSDLDGQPRLTNPTRSGERDQMDVRSRNELRDSRDLLLAAKERGQRCGEVPRSLIGGNREINVPGQLGMDENEDALGPLQVPQLHLAKLLKTGARWQTILCQLLHGLCQQDLTASCHAEYT